MTIGDRIRKMSDEELAEMIINTVTANSDVMEEYRIDIQGYYAFNVNDIEDLEEKLGEDFE